MLLSKFTNKGKKFLGCEYPIICGAMTWISDHKLVSAMGNAGGFGVLAGGNTPVETFEQEIIATRKHTDKPFGINLITLAPLYKEHLRLVCDMKCPVIIFAGGIPKETEIKRARDSGAKVICFTPTEALALRLIKMGADALLIEGSEAGGHIGPVTLTVLLQQILFTTSDVPVFVAGGIATGRMIAHLLMMGAAGVQMGTRFVMAEECKAHQIFKETFRKAKARDAVATPQFDSKLPVVPVRALKNEMTTAFAKLQLELMKKIKNNLIDHREARYDVENFWMGALKKAAIDGNVKEGSLMAGQSVGLVDKIMPVQEILSEIINNAETELQRISRLLRE